MYRPRTCVAVYDGLAAIVKRLEIGTLELPRADDPESSRLKISASELSPRKPRNCDVRPREHLTEGEARQLMKAARSTGRHGHRNATLILITYRHGLRVSEAIALGWNEVNLRQGRLHVRRLKQGMPSVHPLRGPELRALQQLKRDLVKSSYVFVSDITTKWLTPCVLRCCLTRLSSIADQQP